MRYNISRLFGVLVGIPVAFIVWMVTVFAWDLSFLIDAIVGAGGFLLSYFLLKGLLHANILMKSDCHVEIIDMLELSLIKPN